MNTHAEPDHTWYRSREQRVLVMVGGYFASAFVAVMGLALIDVPGAAVGSLAMLVVAALGFFGTYRCARAGARVDDRGVTIVNPTRAVEIGWPDIDRFSVGAYGPWPRIGVAHLRDGSRVVIWGIQGPNPTTRGKNRSAENLIGQLNELVASRRREPHASVA
jgi:hypothetical protein